MDKAKNNPDNIESREEILHRIRHSTAHIMAEAVLELFPDARFGIGPSIENGFYYDFELSRNLTPDDLVTIENRMKELIKARLTFVREVLTRQQALEMFADQPYKVELINELPDDEEISIYRSGNFVDLCRGPHVENSGQLKANAIKLLSIAGAYWRGSEKNPMLQRIYGTAWENMDGLNQHLKLLKDIKERDHRTVGRDMDLYSVHPEAGAGLIYWHPRGARIRTVIEDFWRKAHYDNGYELIYTPHVGKSWLWETSGHLDFYSDSMYSAIEIDEENYFLKPMNCPFHIMIYKNGVHSYRDLPLRWGELGTVYRYERSGVLHGMLRVRGFTQDDAHIICTPEQMGDEITRVLKFCMFMWDSFGFENVKAYISTRPEKSVGPEERWEQATISLRQAVEDMGLDYEVDEGGGAFYGPKIDLKISDALGREWQMSTIQFDFNLPDRFDMTYVGNDGKRHRPYMIHRALLGSIERFFGVLIEHYGGAFPTWLMPVQAGIIPVSAENQEYADKVYAALRAMDARVTMAGTDEPLGARVKTFQSEKIPFVFILGQQEQEAGTVSLRLRGNKKVNGISLDEALSMIREAIETKRG
ncbi:MAG: threonine--tRNA ligase [Candidatus Wallbacteria bacterium HGW-Wallbacteria-1]|uniref:Threonine--tRNA ligase n=1 Tax=Candidatus Wallbacteria bacterium HGW-Wallbacteria-1 TaxID=2013854 RepID=A0A2N1PLN8_9BACT|nr:MAG: threonine--tRNA ligase [Candidatus Wallbacteria bacterium HGW-Wallbacteria-1]